ncbi:MAG: KEOPS complex kinase/ATPase Bud32 [Candidatus Woesearchaeota archaeon]
MTVIDRGAEATITRTKRGVVKSREKKSYRHEDLDARLRQFRTRREGKVLSRLREVAPRVFSVNDKKMLIEMEFVDSSQLRDVLSAENYVFWMKKLAVLIQEVHSRGVVHGDLTTSNVLVRGDELVLIDFGLSEFSEHVEHVAVDLHLLKHSLAAKHPGFSCWEVFWQEYSPSASLVERLEVVESRGRYKGKNA